MRHIPVMLQETLELLNLRAGANVIDCTLGDAGHAEAILEATSPDGKLLGIDADVEAILRAKHHLYRFDARVVFAKNNFAQLADVVQGEAFQPVHGILMDLGWSTPQFAERGRGFSFQNPNEVLDMRYGSGAVATAEELVNELSAGQLTELFEEYGEEKLSKEIAQAIVKKRKQVPLRTVKQLVDVILETYRTKLKTDADIPWVGGLHPATKVFQALRIAANDELGVLKEAMQQALEVLAPGGRLVIISFHSLEDRMVKHAFKKAAVAGVGEILTKKPLMCSDEEAQQNPPSRSAKLRAFQKTA